MHFEIEMIINQLIFPVIFNLPHFSKLPSIQVSWTLRRTDFSDPKFYTIRAVLNIDSMPDFL